MSKKAVRANRSFAKQWFAAISGSVLVISMQTAANASHDRSPSFRDFKSSNPDISNREAHHLFRDMKVNNANSSPAGGNGITAVVPVVNVMWADKNGIVHCGNPPARLLKEDHHRILNQSTQSTISGATVRLASGVDLDLSSADRNITLGDKLFDGAGSATITVGGETKTVSAGSQVTAAEYVAVKQVLGGHTQSVTVDATGRASGGEVDLNSISGPGDVTKASSLVIPENVTTYGVFGRGSEFKLNGDLDNYGSLYALGNGRNGGTVHAEDITNHSGALISSSGIKLADHRHVGSSATDLNLIADGALLNEGAISSGGNINLSAGSSLTNSGNIEAKHNVNLNSANISNSGTVASTTGDITLDGPANAELKIDNTGGTLSALNAINLRNTAYDGTFNTTVTGGDLLSKDLNINAGNATANVTVGDLTGEVHEKGLAAHIAAATADLNIGSSCLTGDPTYYNTIGNINIAGNITVGEDLVIVATGNITSASGVTITAGDAVQGYNITLIAGANFVSTVGGADQGAVGPIPPANANNGMVVLSSGSVGGGSITLGGSNIFNTQTTGAVGQSGDVQFVAFAGSQASSGKVNLTGSAITTGGKGGQSGGDVEVIAGAANTAAIIMNVVNTSGGFGLPGNITLTAAQPAVAGGGVVVAYGANGARLGTDFYAPSNTVSPGGSITVGSLTGGVIKVRAGGNIISSSLVAGNDVTYQSDSTTFVSSNINATNTFTAFGNNFTQTNTSNITVTGAGGTAAVSVTGNILGSSQSIFRGDNMFLFTSGGKIGTSSGNKFRIDADDLTVNAPSGSAYIFDTTSLDLNITTVGGTADIQTGDLMTVVGTVSADVVKLTSADQIVLTAPVSAGLSATLHASTDIVATVASAVVSGSSIVLQADSGAVGGINNPININGDNLFVFAPGSSAFVSDPDLINLGGGNTFVGGDFSVQAGVGITSSSIVTVGLDANFDAGTLSLAAPVVAGSSIALVSSASVTNANITGGLSAPLISIASGGNIGTSTVAPLNIDANQLEVLAAGNVFVKDPNDVILGPLAPSGAGGVFNLVAGGNLDLTNGITATGVVTLTAVNMQQSTGEVAGSSVILLATGNIGNNGMDRVTVNTTTFSASTSGDHVFIFNNNAGTSNLVSANAANTLDVFAAGNLSSSANLLVPDLTLGSFGNLNLSGNLSNNGQITLRTGNALLNSMITGTVQTNYLSLASLNGDIGASNAAPFVLNGEAPKVSLSAGGGNAFVRNQNTSGIELTDSAVDGLLSFVSDGGLTISGSLSSTSDKVSVSAANQTLQINAGTTITAKTGIDITNNGTSKSDKLIISKDVTMSTSAKTAGQGDINITLGVAGGKVKKTPQNVTAVNTGPGVVTFRGKGAKASGPTNTFTAQGANVTVSNSVSAKNLTIGGNVNLTADPPVAPDAVTEIIIGGRNSNVPPVIAPITNTAPNVVSISRADTIGQQFDNSRLNMLATLSANINTPNSTVPQELRLKRKKTVKISNSEQLHFVWTTGDSISQAK